MIESCDRIDANTKRPRFVFLFNNRDEKGHNWGAFIVKTIIVQYRSVIVCNFLIVFFYCTVLARLDLTLLTFFAVESTW